MIKKLFIACAAFVWTIALVAQNISVVSSGGSTKLYRTLEAAIKGADPNSVIYLPGGGFPIADSVKITKKLTIIGIGHKSKNDNVDGNTTISGNLYFYHGSDGSALMGCYVTGNINIGSNISSDQQIVNDIMVKTCNVYNIYVNHPECQGTFISQNYIRHVVSLMNSEATIKNNIIKGDSNGCIKNMGAGVISNNLLLMEQSTSYGYLYNVSTAIVTGNIITNTKHKDCGTISTSGNACLNQEYGDDPINLQANSWDDVFVKYNNGKVNPASNFHFKDEYKQYENQVGVYADGVDFDKQLASVPYIVAKKIDPQTDTAGKLNIKIRVKASGEE